MPVRLRRVLIGVLFVLLASWAWYPLFDSGLRGDELALVAALADAGPRGAFGVEAFGGHPLPVLDLWLTLGSSAPSGGWMHGPTWILRLESILWLCFAAWMIGRCARRVLLPWSGGELARAAGWAASLLFALHPLSVGSIASIGARGELMALGFCAAGGWAYLRGRQERHEPSLALAALFVVVAALCADLALGTCVWLAGAEIASARRHRKASTRLRSALATFGATAVCISVDSLLRSAVLGAWSPPRAITALELPGSAALWAQQFGLTFERLGTLFLPVPEQVVGTAGFVLAGAITLAALQPVLIAARSAPRLWGWMLLGFSVALLVAELFAPAARVHPDDLRDAATLASAVAITSVALGVAITSLSGMRRVLLPLLVALGWTVLGHAHALACRSAAREVALVAEALERVASDPLVFVVDAPLAQRGVGAFEGVGRALGHPAVNGRAPLEVRMASSPAFTALAREPEFGALRARGVGLLHRALGRAWVLDELGVEAPSASPRSWGRDGRSPELDIAPGATGALSVRPIAGSATVEPPVVGWRAGADEGESGRLEGRWAYLGEAPEALFDLSSSLNWLGAARVKLVWSVEGWSRIQVAEFLDELPPPPVTSVPRSEGRDWVFDSTGDSPVDAGDARRSWTFVWLDLDALETTELAVERRAEQLVVRDAVGRAGESGTRLRWSLETRIEGRAIERLRGTAR